GRKLLDTSVIIDGRIVELCETGFIEGVLVIPQFILTEVQQIADSPSSIKRTRGKRGLDIVNKLQNQGIVPVEIVDKDFPQITEVDSKLLELAKSTGAKILTNDYNLKKVAKIQDVLVLNINELATSLKPVLLPGERLRINILKEGENPNQGVAYLDDGTMVVVEGGKRHIGKETEVTVTSVLQTTTGKMIFTEIKGENERKKAEKRRNKPKS
ncbi:TRAM domain-containing protein, partial [Patescibacteria group bacterium]|nr:TRAM domain-containing protein [Patescibacteria group bacterium]